MTYTPPPGRSMSDAELAIRFTYHPSPNAATQQKYVTLRDAAHDFARLVRDLVPPSAGCTTAINKIQEAVMWANKAIACDSPREEAGPSERELGMHPGVKPLHDALEAQNQAMGEPAPAGVQAENEPGVINAKASISARSSPTPASPAARD